MSETAHTVTSYDDDLRFLSDRIARMGGHAERMVDRAVTALIRSDHALSKEVIADDATLDAWERELIDKSVLVIAKRQPMAGDLREIIGTMRIASDLERIGDLGKNIAKRTVAVAEIRQPVRLYRGLESLAELAMIQMKEVLDTFANRNIEGISRLRDRDEEIDAKYTSLFRELLTYMMEDPRNISACTHLLFCAKNIERIGDHVTNIAENIHYMVTGEELKAERPKDDQSNAVVVGN
jgi:phosphate transport system protein